ncbi:hypothetical protein TOK_0646 [Pseudonocardia sp. N23]|nr:hypothetical protein TOK_0646 [Pseudonocardia sp. N23]
MPLPAHRVGAAGQRVAVRCRRLGRPAPRNPLRVESRSGPAHSHIERHCVCLTGRGAHVGQPGSVWPFCQMTRPAPYDCYDASPSSNVRIPFSLMALRLYPLSDAPHDAI